MARPDHAPQLTVGPASGAVRRRLGPTAWTVPEDVLLHAQIDDDDVVVAVTSVRAVAGRLGLATSTVARAFVVLIEEELLVGRQRRDEERGTFAAGSYQCRVDAVPGLTVVPCPASEPSAPPPSRRISRAKPKSHQPTLFVDDATQFLTHASRPEAALELAPSIDHQGLCTHGHPAVAEQFTPVESPPC